MPLRPGPVVLVAGGLLLFPAAAAADTITLLSPTARTSEPPPLVGKRIAGVTAGETRFSGRLRNVERVAVGIDRSGAPVGVVVTQRLTISRPGDFTFLVPAPATKVVAAPGSQAEPGLRDLGIVWQGFASGRRVLAATITLAPTAAAVLPLRVSVERRAGAIVVTVGGRRARTLHGHDRVGCLRRRNGLPRSAAPGRGRRWCRRSSRYPAAPRGKLSSASRRRCVFAARSRPRGGRRLPCRSCSVRAARPRERSSSPEGPCPGSTCASSRSGPSRYFPARATRCHRWRASSGCSEPLLSHGSTTTSSTRRTRPARAPPCTRTGRSSACPRSRPPGDRQAATTP